MDRFKRILGLIGGKTVNIICPKCFRDVEVLLDGLAERHLPGPKVTLTPDSFCDYSLAQVVPESALKTICERCEKEVAVGLDGEVENHFAGPNKTFSPDRYCGQECPRTMDYTPRTKFNWESGHHSEFNQ